MTLIMILTMTEPKGKRMILAVYVCIGPFDKRIHFIHLQISFLFAESLSKIQT